MNDDEFDEELQNRLRKFEIQSIAKQDQYLQEFKLFVESLSPSQRTDFREALAMIVEAQRTFSKISERMEIFLSLTPPFCISEDGEVIGTLMSAHLSPNELDNALAAWERESEFPDEGD